MFKQAGIFEIICNIVPKMIQHATGNRKEIFSDIRSL